MLHRLAEGRISRPAYIALPRWFPTFHDAIEDPGAADDDRDAMVRAGLEAFAVFEHCVDIVRTSRD